MSRLPDLSDGKLIAIWGVTIAAILLVFLRAAVAIGRFWSKEHRYPVVWTAQQTRYLQLTRIYVGIALIVTWATLLVASPFLPQRYPFSQSSALLFIGLLVQSYAWLLMITPQNWNYSPIARFKFNPLLGATILWWATFLGIMLYLIAALSVPNIFQRPPSVPANYA